MIIKLTSRLLLTLAMVCPPASSWETLTDNLDLSCQQDSLGRLDCSYRLLIPEPPLSISARHDELAIPISDRESYPWSNAITAVLLLVDTSDPGRQRVIENNREQIRRILEQSHGHHRTGLASFDDNLQIEAPVGSSDEFVIQAAEGLSATGRTTELYRNAIKAIEHLAGVMADRKVIYLFSDGQAEDRAYFHQDVTRAARENNVVINSIGFPRTVSLSVALQTLRRLSEETGGIYIEAEMDYSLPEGFLARPFDNIDRGGRFTLDISPLATVTGNATEVRLDFATDIGDIAVQVPVKLPAPNQSARPEPRIAATPPATTASPSPEIRIVTAPGSPATNRLDRWLWYGVPVALLVLIAMTIAAVLLLFRRQDRRDQPKPVTIEQIKPYAYLISQDEKQTRYPVTRGIWRIGRSRDNELTLDDNSVSRRHAELQRQENGNFVICDLDSLNGVFINEEQVSRQELKEGDIIEIGDFYLRYTQHPLDYQISEETVLQKTRAPWSS